MKPILVRVYGDSLGLPRASEGVNCAETYAELLAAALERHGRKVHLYNRSRGGVRVEELRELCDVDTTYFGEPEKTLIVIQCGIVDCAPRPVPRNVREFIAVLPLRVRGRIIRFLHDNRSRILRSVGPWRETPPANFIRVFSAWLRSASQASAAVAVINVAPTTPQLEQHSPGWSKAIASYNGLIAEAIQSVDSDRVVLVDAHHHITREEGGIARYVNARDGHHITGAGHALYSELVVRAVTPLMQPSVEVSA